MQNHCPATHQHITGHHGLAPPAVVHTAKEEVVLLRSIGGINHDDAAQLCQGLHLQHACRVGSQVAGRRMHTTLSGQNTAAEHAGRKQTMCTTHALSNGKVGGLGLIDQA